MSSTLVLLCLALAACVFAQCPHDRTGLTKWSTQSAWNQANAAVTIAAGQSVILDASPPNTIKSINIFGELIFANTNLNLNVSFIRIEQGGKLTMGGADPCRLTAKIIVTFYGARDTTGSDLGTNPSDGAALGSKGLAAVTGSYLEIWGSVKTITWSRLTKAAAAGATSITLEDSVTGIWKVGDSIALASTDYYPTLAWNAAVDDSVSWQKGAGFAEQSEDVVISAISADGKTLTLATALKNPHFASSENTDVRGEVGLLSRNIVFQGDQSVSTTYFGGHFMIRDVKRAWINGAEFRQMAQRGVMGRYPVHFHLMGAGSMDGIAYLKDSSIHHNFQRCVTIHDTRGVLVQNNVAYWNNGHCFFLEDGCETNNVFDGNLGITIAPVSGESGNRLVPTDSQPSIFWITNPSNDFTNNVGVGGFHTFWFSMPVQPVGISKAKYASDTQMRPRLMPMGKFSGNVAHGAMQNGVHIDDMQKPDETVEHTTGYTPVQGPYSDSTQMWQYTAVQAVFSDLVLYKNRQWGFWSRGQPFRLTNIRTYDNQFGVLTVPGTNYVENSVFTGDSDNLGVPRNAADMGRSRPQQWGDPSAYIIGLMSYDNGGQQLFRNNIFKNFVSTASRRAGALGFLPSGRFLLHSRNRVSSATFVNSNQMWFQQTTTSDLNNNAQLLDLDGTSTGIKGGAWMVANASILLQPDCVPKYEWNGYVCPPNRAGYIQFYMTNPALSATNYVGSDGIDHRSDVGTVGQTPIRLNFWKLKSDSNPTATSWAGVGSDYNPDTMSYYLNAQPMQAYAVRWAYDTPSPPKLTMAIQSAAPGDWILMAFPYPSGTTFTITYGSATLAQAPNLAAMYAPQSTVSSTYYFYDTNSGYLFVRLENTANKPQSNYWNGYGYSDYTSDYNTLTLNAACPSSNCRSTKLTLPVLGTIDSDEYYRANLQVCQQDAGKRSAIGALGSGVAFLAFNPTTRILKFNVYHDLGERATQMLLKTSTRTLPFDLTPFGPVRGMFSLTYGDWKDLVQGQLSLVLVTKTNSNGELVGKIGCENTCTVPPQIGGQTPCADITNSKIIFSKGPYGAWPDWQIGKPWSNQPAVFNNTADLDSTVALCGAGDNSIKVSLLQGGFQVAKWSNDFLIDTTVLTHFEMFIRMAPNQKRVVLQASLNDGSKAYNFNIGDNADIINTFAVDDTTWSRVRVKLTDIGLTSKASQLIQLFQVGIYSESQPVTFYIDNLRFVPAYTDSMTAAISTATVYKTAAICSDASGGTTMAPSVTTSAPVPATTRGTTPTSVTATTTGAPGQTTTLAPGQTTQSPTSDKNLQLTTIPPSASASTTIISMLVVLIVALCL